MPTPPLKFATAIILAGRSLGRKGRYSLHFEPSAPKKARRRSTSSKETTSRRFERLRSAPLAGRFSGPVRLGVHTSQPAIRGASSPYCKQRSSSSYRSVMSICSCMPVTILDSEYNTLPHLRNRDRGRHTLPGYTRLRTPVSGCPTPPSPAPDRASAVGCRRLVHQPPGSPSPAAQPAFATCRSTWRSPQRLGQLAHRVAPILNLME